MARTRERTKGRRGGEIEPFAKIPMDVMTSEAGQTLPHAAFHILAILVAGKANHRNGSLAVTDAYAARFGITSHETVSRAIAELQARGLIVKTRQGMKLRYNPTLWRVTWLPSCYRDGELLDRPELATYDYHKWRPNTPIVGVNTNDDAALNTAELHPDSRGTVTPMVGVLTPLQHPDLPPQRAVQHPDHRGNSKILEGGMREQGAASASPPPDSLPKSPSERGRPKLGRNGKRVVTTGDVLRTFRSKVSR